MAIHLHFTLHIVLQERAARITYIEMLEVYIMQLCFFSAAPRLIFEYRLLNHENLRLGLSCNATGYPDPENMTIFHGNKAAHGKYMYTTIEWINLTKQIICYSTSA